MEFPSENGCCRRMLERGKSKEEGRTNFPPQALGRLSRLRLRTRLLVYATRQSSRASKATAGSVPLLEGGHEQHDPPLILIPDIGIFKQAHPPDVACV
jgi:hypothetical protein